MWVVKLGKRKEIRKWENEGRRAIINATSGDAMHCVSTIDFINYYSNFV